MVGLKPTLTLLLEGVKTGLYKSADGGVKGVFAVRVDWLTVGCAVKVFGLVSERRMVGLTPSLRFPKKCLKLFAKLFACMIFDSCIEQNAIANLQNAFYKF